MKTYLLPLLAAAVLITPLRSPAALVTVVSSNTAPGWFTYSIVDASGPFSLGSSYVPIALSVKSYFLMDTLAPPGWITTTTQLDTVSWSYTGSVQFVVGTNPLVFSLHSASETPIIYDMASPTDDYPRGTIVGDVFTAAGQRQQATTEDTIPTANLAVQDRFVHLGPLVPEPAMLISCALVAALLNRNRRPRTA